MSSTSENHYYNRGCTLANNVDSGIKPVDSLTVLGFGMPIKFSGSSWGASLFGGPDSTISTIRQLSQNFALGFYDCLHNHFATAKIALMTSNYNINGWTNSDLGDHGAAWGQMINGANTWAQNQGVSAVVSFAGSSDIEVEWATPTKTRAWVDGFGAGVNDWNLFNVGNATDCTAGSASCYGAWDKVDLWYVSWGSTFSNGAPQIYATSGANATQWFAVAKYGTDNHPAAGTINFVTSVSQAANCPCPPNSNNPPDTSWAQLWNAIHPGPTSDDIRWSINFIDD